MALNQSDQVITDHPPPIITNNTDPTFADVDMALASPEIAQRTTTETPAVSTAIISSAEPLSTVTIPVMELKQTGSPAQADIDRRAIIAQDAQTIMDLASEEGSTPLSMRAYVQNRVYDNGVTQAPSSTKLDDSTNESTISVQNQRDAGKIKEVEISDSVLASMDETPVEREDIDEISRILDSEAPLDLTDPRWLNDDNEEGPLLPQPESFQGKSTKTGYVYDVRMRFHNNVHGEDDHPEDPRRIWRIFEALDTTQCTNRMIRITSREATVDELNLVHTENHINNITKTAVMTKDDLLEMANNYNSIYLNNSSAFCARLSCGSLIELCKAVALGQVLNGVAIIRPPGHHAEPDEAGGFCLYNNVAIAARYLQKFHGLKKIFILDWDVHHGNGTQTAFYDDPDVVYCSIHRFDYGKFYPGDPIAAAHTAIGEGAGRGRTINIPWNDSGMGDSEYIYAFNKVIMPILYEFAPDFVLVSAGFDAAKGDHIGQMLVTPPAYGHMTHMLKSLAGGKIILALEGGYNLDSIAVSGLACAKALLNDPIEPLDPIIPNAMCVQTIQDVIEVQSRYWKSLPQTFIDPIEDSAGVRSIVGMNKILDIYRKRCLRERHDMIPMPRIEGDQENAFLDNVYCTRRTYNAKPLYIFVHDFGEFSAKTLAHNNIVRTDKSLLVDPVTDYVRRIIDSGNELIDVVLPYQPTSDEEKVALKDKLSSILSEIWDSYVSATGYTGRRIILLAAGFGCYGMVAFMNERQKEIIKYVSCVTMVPGDDSLPMVTKKLGSWYVENSFVFLTDDHPVWERTQKPNSRNGNLIRSEQSTSKLSVLLHHLQGKIFKDIENRLDNLPAVSGDDSDLDIKKDPEPMETDPAPTLVQNDDLSTNSQNEEIKMTITPPKEELQSNTSPQNRLQPPSPISSPLTPVKVEVARSQPPHPLSSLPGSPHLNGMSTPRPHAQPLVDRSSVVSQQHRSQPYPSPNGRSQNGPVSMTQPGSSRSFAASGSPQLRASNPKPMMELQEMKPRPMVSTQQQYQQQQYIDEQRHIESQRQQQYRQQQPDQDTHPLHHRHQHSRSENHPYSEQATNKKVPRSAGPGEYYPTPSTANGSAAVSPSTMTPPHTYSSNGSPHAPHSSLKSNPQQRSPQHQHYSTGYGPQSNGGYRSGPPPSTSASNQPYESMHYQRGSYSSQGPPPVNNGQHQAPHLSPNYRYSGRSQQHQQQQQQQHHMNSPNRMKRSEIESDPYGSHFAQPQPQSQSQFPQPRQQHPEMDRHVEAERQRWEMEQIRQQKVMQHGDRGYDVHGPPPPIYTQQQQQQQQHRHYQNPQQHSHSHVQHHYEPIQHERQHSTMVKQSHHLQHPH